MINKIIGGVAVLALILSIVGLVSNNQPAQSFGATGTRFPNGLSADSTSPSAGQIRGTTLLTTGASTFGGNVTVTTGASATSTLSAGCINTYATSSATQIKLVFNTSATTTSINGGTVQGVVAWQYGSCPI